MPMPPRFATLLLLFLPWMAFAQPASNPRVESLRIAFITERLELSPKESEAFWPAIRVHHRELESLRRRIDDLLDEAKAGVTENQRRFSPPCRAFNKRNSNGVMCCSRMPQASSALPEPCGYRPPNGNSGCGWLKKSGTAAAALLPVTDRQNPVRS
jgi:hypothetical protein